MGIERPAPEIEPEEPGDSERAPAEPTVDRTESGPTPNSKSAVEDEDSAVFRDTVEEALDRGLRVAFGGGIFGSADEGADSLNLRQTEVAGVGPGFPAAEFGIGLEPSLGDANSHRYRLGPELGRGGVGVVMRANDVDLGRELALKVLLDDHRHNPAMTQRFIEEAQVAGQLQHPGIVPVHQIGKLDDGRLYFSMKLIRGTTLADGLAKRETVAAERQHFLGVFLKVCQTMAYAHARRVVHRDLKPGNIMVGSFGEVQVVDWGLAKVLPPLGMVPAETATESEVIEPDVETLRSTRPATASMAGTVMGTPSYMSPEQARGEVDRLDERTDVFGLGAILCEILSGRPPYKGQTSVEVRARAAVGDLDEAVTAIDACDADPEVCALARRCLALLPADRPADAGEVARELSRYLDSLEERAHASDLAAAEARGAARQERRARNLTTALAIVGLLFVVGVAVYWIDRAQRRSQAEVAVEQSLSRADRLASAAVGLHDRKALERSVDAAQAAVETAERGWVADDLLERARRERQRLGEALERARWVERLRAVRDSHGDDPDWVATEPGYAPVFAEYADQHNADHNADEGSDAVVSAGGRPLSSLAEAEWITLLSASGIPEEFATALSDWSRFLRRSVRQDAASTTAGDDAWRRLVRIARAIDPDPVRARIRDAFERENLPLLRRAALTRAWETPDQAVLLGSTLLELNEPRLGLSVFRAAAVEHPEDYWVVHGCGVSYLKLDSPDYRASLPYFQAALALRPQSAHGWVELAGVHQALGNTDTAVTHFRRAIEFEPQFDRARLLLARLLMWGIDGNADASALEEAQALLERAASGPYSAVAYTDWADLERRRGEFAESRRLADQALAQDPSYSRALAVRARTESEAGDQDSAIESIAQALELQPRSARYQNDLASFEMARGDAKAALEALQRATKFDPSFLLAQRSLGELRQKQGDLDQALESYREVLSKNPNATRAWYKLGTVQQVKGDRAWLASFEKAIELDRSPGQARLRDEAKLDMFTRLYGAGVAAHGEGSMIQAAAYFGALTELSPVPDSIPPAAYEAILYFAGQSFQAVGSYERALNAYSRVLESPSAEKLPRTELIALAWCHAGQCLEVLHRFDEAVSRFEQGVEACREAKSTRLADAERWLAGGRRTVALRALGLEAAPSPDEVPMGDAFSYGRLFQAEGEPVKAARYYRRAIEQLEATAGDPPPSWHRVARYSAAVAAFEASRSTSIIFKERREWEAVAQAYLESNLAQWRRLVEAESVPDRERRFRLEYWLIDPTWADVRDPLRQSNLSREVRLAWSRIWSQHAQLLP